MLCTNAATSICIFRYLYIKPPATPFHIVFPVLTSYFQEMQTLLNDMFTRPMKAHKSKGRTLRPEEMFLARNIYWKTSCSRHRLPIDVTRIDRSTCSFLWWGACTGEVSLPHRCTDCIRYTRRIGDICTRVVNITGIMAFLHKAWVLVL